MNFLKFLYIIYAALSLRNFIMKFKWPMQAVLFFFLFITDNYGYCVKKNFHTNLHSTFYMLFYYVVSYDIWTVFSQLCISTILLMHARYFVELWSLRKELFSLWESMFTRYPRYSREMILLTRVLLCLVGD